MSTRYETMSDTDVALGVECALPWLEHAPRTRPLRRPRLTRRGVLRLVAGRNLKELIAEVSAPGGVPAGS